MGANLLQDHWKIRLGLSRFEAREFREKAMKLFFR
jgi:hypothetical protein